MRPALLWTLIAMASSGAVHAAPEQAGRDPARVAQTVDAARQARQQGDVMAAERLCYAAFDTIETSVLAAYDAYADRLKEANSADAPTVRTQAQRLHELRASRAGAKEPASTYLGFAPADGLHAYAELLRGVHYLAEAERMHSLALAYQQEQQAHFNRTMLFRQGKDPRGAC